MNYRTARYVRQHGNAQFASAFMLVAAFCAGIGIGASAMLLVPHRASKPQVVPVVTSKAVEGWDTAIQLSRDMERKLTNDLEKAEKQERERQRRNNFATPAQLILAASAMERLTTGQVVKMTEFNLVAYLLCDPVVVHGLYRDALNSGQIELDKMYLDALEGANDETQPKL